MIIYMATNKVNGKSYVGQTIGSLKKRKESHISVANRNINNIYFHRSIRKYGTVNFYWKILHECNDIETLNKLEIYYIGLYDTYRNGYNLTLGGDGSVGYEVSENTKRKISASLEGENNPNYGKFGKNNHWYEKSHSEESKKRMSEAQKRRRHFEKIKGITFVGLKGKDHPNYGKKMSDEQKKRLSGIRKGRYIGKDNSMARAVIIHDKYFDTRKEAAEFLKVSAPTISNRIKKNVEGYKYADT